MRIIIFLFPSQVLAKEQIEQLTAQAWVSENKQLEDKVRCLVLLATLKLNCRRNIVHKFEGLQRLVEKFQQFFQSDILITLKAQICGIL